jgi:hypothetical protein
MPDVAVDRRRVGPIGLHFNDGKTMMRDEMPAALLKLMRKLLKNPSPAAARLWR